MYLKEWLTQLKVGDIVIISSSSAGTNSSVIASVVRLTPKRIIVKYGDSEKDFIRERGVGVGASAFHSSYLVEPTEDAIAKIRLRQSRLAMKKMLNTIIENVDNFNEEQLISMHKDVVKYVL